MTDVPAESNDRNEQDRPGKSEPRPMPYARGGTRGRGGLHFYKPSQGYYTRMLTAVGGMVLILWGGAALFDQLTSFIDAAKPYYYPVSYGVTVAFVVGMGGFLYWLVGLSRRPNDFFIATEGEMKKVSWSTRREVIRSTKVVIASVLLLGLMLFLVDVFFMWFFSAIGVLKAFPGVWAMFSGEPS